VFQRRNVIVANAAGCENGSALARVFRKELGVSPKEWLEKAF
jgi:AraC-like DNA-binding protein